MLAHGIGDVGGSQAEAGELDRVQPQAHGEDLVAEDLRLSHAWQGRQFGLDHP
ncbi:hypothetical protein D3C84_1266240 [compost metagenome]